MKIISRYVLSELLQVFLVALSALTLFMLVVGLVKEAQQQGLGMMQIAALVPYVLPEAMRFAVPARCCSPWRACSGGCRPPTRSPP